MSSVLIDSDRARIRAALVNTGHSSFAEADRALESSSVSVLLADEAGTTAAGQAAFLTATVTAARCFGEVRVDGHLERPLLLPLQIAMRSLTLAQAARSLGAQVSSQEPSKRNIVIGNSLEGPAGSIRAFWNGWVAGVAPAKEPSFGARSDCPLAGVAAGALAVGQVFLAEQGDLRAGKAGHRVSLWAPTGAEDTPPDTGPELRDCCLPLHLWLVGLGNLGQAYLWALGLLPYPQPDGVLLFLQDDDLVQRPNWGTSILVERGRYGQLKTKIAEEWAERRGFRVRRLDRRLDEHLRRAQQEPGLLLAGLDRMTPRLLLGRAGFDYIVDAGLGASATDYHKFRMNTFDSSSDPAVHFKGLDDQSLHEVERLMALPAYQELASSSGDRCGTALLAESSVAVPFVSAFAGALSVAQTVRIASAQAPYFAVSGSIADVENVRAMLGNRPGRSGIASVRAER